jgi:Uma2 family endonuclease
MGLQTLFGNTFGNKGGIFMAINPLESATVIHQDDLLRPPKETLPTMYDLPSEDPEEPGLPDNFHDFQPQLLRETFHSPHYQPEQFFIARDLNLYYDIHHFNWYKRPDWFIALNVPSLFEGDLRLSYVIWQEGVAPFLVVELLSPGTEKEDLGQTVREINQPPTKWEVYEQILRIPYYVVFSRYTDELKVFELANNRYQELKLPEPRFWLAPIGLGLGLWSGTYERIERQWLRWYDAQNLWIPTPAERLIQEKQQVEQERQRAEQERQRAEQLAEQLRALGIEPK